MISYHYVVLSDSVFLSDVSGGNDGNDTIAAPGWEEVVNKRAILIQRGSVQFGGIAQSQAPPSQAFLN